jgi:uncharacterized protein YbaR (Trm112 family)
MIGAKPSHGTDSHLLNLLVCPRDHSELNFENGQLSCAHAHRYPIVNGIPVFIVVEKEQTLAVAAASLRGAESGIGHPLYVDTLGLSEEQKRGIERDWNAEAKIDAAISYLVGATSGLGYVELIGRLESYPIPRIPVANGDGKLLLDIGSNWGRWSVSAAQKGWRVVGIDPSLGALLAAQRAFSRMSLDVTFICVTQDTCHSSQTHFSVRFPIPSFSIFRKWIRRLPLRKWVECFLEAASPKSKWHIKAV